MIEVLNNKNSIDISIILLTYNHEKYVVNALESILSQDTNYSYEIIVGDDCSTDNTQIILREYKLKYPDKFELVLRDNNIGANKNYFDCENRAKGRYIASIEGDDFWIGTEKLQRQAEFLDENLEYVGVAHQYKTCDEKGNILPKHKDITFVRKGIVQFDDLMINSSCYHTSTIMYRAKLDYKKNEIYKKILEYHPVVGDQCLRFFLLDSGNVYILPEFWSTFRYVLKKNGTNARSLYKRAPIKSTAILLEQLLLLQEYFGDRRKITKRIVKKYIRLKYLIIRFGRKFVNDSAYAKEVLNRFPSKYKIVAVIYVPVILFDKIRQAVK